MTLGFLFLLVSLSAGVAAAPPPIDLSPTVLTPSSDWYLDYAEGHCRLVRQFGSDDEKTIFYLEQYEPGDRFTVLAAGPDFRPSTLRLLSLRFSPGGGEAPTARIRDTAQGQFGEGVMTSSMTLLEESEPEPIAAPIPAGTTSYNPPAPQAVLDPSLAARVNSFELLEHGRPVVRLMIGSMSGPIKAMNACTDDLLTHWGIDLAEHRHRSRAPEPLTNPATWISARDYPSGLLRNGQQGIVVFRLSVDESGLPTACHIQQATDPAEFNNIVCRKMMKSARFTPALDSAGKPMASYWLSSINFEIPR